MDAPDINDFCFSGEDTPENLLAIWISQYMSEAEEAEFRRLIGELFEHDSVRKVDADTMISLISTARFMAS